jgi:hypothetical protein
MKNLIFALSFVCLGITTQAHTIGNVLCGTNGRVKISGTYFDYDGTQHPSYVLLYITTNGQSTGTKKWQGKAFITSQGKFSMDTVPFFSYSTSDRKVFWVQYEWSQGQYKATDWDGVITLQTSCTAMPITLTSWTAKVDANDSTLVHLAWSVDMENNVDYYRIDGSTDNGKTWDLGITKLNSLGDTNAKRDYKLDYYNPLVGLLVKTAGFGVGGMLLAIAIFAGSIRNRALAGVVGCVMLVTTFACKKDVTAQKQTLKYNAVRLTEVDKDGTEKSFDTRFLKY